MSVEGLPPINVGDEIRWGLSEYWPIRLRRDPDPSPGVRRYSVIIRWSEGDLVGIVATAEGRSCSFDHHRDWHRLLQYSHERLAVTERLLDVVQDRDVWWRRHVVNGRIQYPMSATDGKEVYEA